MLVLAGGVLTSCDDESEGKSRIVYYPVLELVGDSKLIVDLGSTFEDPGCKATMNGEDISEEIKVTSNVDTRERGAYTVTYSITNAEGFSASTRRTVYVVNKRSAIEGVYRCDPESTRDNNGAVTKYGKPFDILIYDNGDGTYEVDDLLGGWYCQRAGYGTDYAMKSTIAVDDATGEVSLIESFVPGWEDEASSLTGKFDAATGHFSWVCVYTDIPLIFYVELDKE